ncbi:MAG TPA: hypothetical protein VGS07_10085 [Thermoanaerobaculia bacterium]|nr:hypothetical protein [Thermoanaerobaculia bacterium]
MTPETNQANPESSAMAAEITLHASFEEVICTINGQSVDTSKYTPIAWWVNPDHMYSYLAFMVDRRTARVVSSAAHAGLSGSEFYARGHHDPGASTLPGELSKHNDPDHILIFVWASVVDVYDETYQYDGTCLLSPQGDLMKFLLSSGTTAGWWNSFIDKNFLFVQGPGIYALIGVCGSGPGNGVEGRAEVSIATPAGPEMPPNPSVQLTAQLSLQSVAGEPLLTPAQ